MRQRILILAVLLSLAHLAGCDDDVIVPAPAPDTVRVSFQDGVRPTSAYHGTADAVIKDGPASEIKNGNFGVSVSDTLGSAAISTGFRERRLIISMDLTSITSCSKVLSAELTLRIVPPASGAMTIGAHVVGLPDWKQWVEGIGVPAGGVSWTTIDGADPWGQEGGDFETVEFDRITVSTESKLTISLPPTTVRSWILDENTNHGVILTAADVSRELYAIVFLREYGIADWRPRLDITYLKGG